MQLVLMKAAAACLPITEQRPLSYGHRRGTSTTGWTVLEAVPVTGSGLASVFAARPVPDDRSSHAVPAAAAAPELGTDDRGYLDAGVAQRSVGLSVAVIGEHHARFQRNGVVRTVPQLAFGIGLPRGRCPKYGPSQHGPSVTASV